MTWAAVVVSVVLLGLVSPVEAKTQRSAKAKAEFRRLNPCPSNGEVRGRCPGYVIDHVAPLCDGGADASDNMAWQSIPEAKRKDRAERAVCGVSGGTTLVMEDEHPVSYTHLTLPTNREV